MNVAADQTFQNGNVVISDIKVSSARGNAYSVKDVLTCGITQFTDPTLDGKWDISDVYAVLSAFGTDNAICDLNNDGMVDISDVYETVAKIK